MTIVSIILPNYKRKWYGLALRHLRMASRLLDSGFPDGATFHAYHAYESFREKYLGLSLANRGIQDRSAHKARLMFFIELTDPTKTYATLHATLRRYLTLDVRMDSLYYDAILDRLPHQTFGHPFAFNLIPQVHLFAQEVWKEIR